MDNVWTLMVFGSGQVQPIVMQYKSPGKAREHRDALNSSSIDKVTVCDDYGRELSIRPMDAPVVLLQDIDAATEGNGIATVKSGVSQGLSDVRARAILDNHEEVVRYNNSVRLKQGAAGGAIRM